MKTFFSFLLSIPAALAGAFVFSNAWNWFLVRKFPSLPTITTLDAVGFLIVFSFPLLNSNLARYKEKYKEKNPEIDSDVIDIVTSLGLIFIGYPVMLGVMYVWSLVIG